MARLSFGVCFAPDPPPSRWVDLTKLAEAQGFEYAWLFDSHVLWQEVYPIFTLMAANTRTIKIGPCVTNPGPRDPTPTPPLSNGACNSSAKVRRKPDAPSMTS